jgi:iron complex outermembrane receptor protein
MKQLIDILHNEGLTLVIKSGDGEIRRFTGRGVKDLLMLAVEHQEVLKGALIADKAVGKAAAACMVVGGIKRVHADVMSEPALALLQDHGIIAEYGQLVDHIINRDGTDWCPMEKLSRDENNPAAIVARIQDFFQSH